MKKNSQNLYQKPIQTQQENKNIRPDTVQRVDRYRQNLNLNHYTANSEHYRKHNSPDANKLRHHQNQNENQIFFSKNIKNKNITDGNHQNVKPLQQPQQLIQTFGQVRPLTKTSSSPKLLQNRQQEALNQDHHKKQFLYTETDEYKKLHQKLNSIEDKIMNMKKNIQKKREEKQKLLEKQKKEKLQQEKRPQSQDKQKGKNLLKGLVTQVPEHKELHTFQNNPYSPRHNIYYVSQVVRAYQDEKSLARQHIMTSLHILKILQKSQIPSDEEMKRRAADIPIKKGKQSIYFTIVDRKCVVFDLDETLIHCNDNLNPPCDVKLPIKFPTGQVIEAGINIRPYAKQILKNLSKTFEVIVFTASHSCYANVVLDYLDPNNEFIDHRLYREHCYQTAEGMYVKDLRVLGRDLKDVALVDNAAYSYAFQLDNGVPILPYYHGSQDFELKALEKFVNSYLMVSDVRAINRKTFYLHKYKDYYGDVDRMVEQIYLNEEKQESQKSN